MEGEHPQLIHLSQHLKSPSLVPGLLGPLKIAGRARLGLCRVLIVQSLLQNISFMNSESFIAHVEPLQNAPKQKPPFRPLYTPPFLPLSKKCLAPPLTHHSHCLHPMNISDFATLCVCATWRPCRALGPALHLSSTPSAPPPLQSKKTL